MQTVSGETENRSLLPSGLGMVMRNKRYIIWFWLLNLLLTYYGTSAFREVAHSLFDQNLYSDKLLHGLDLSVVIDMFLKPEFSATRSMTVPAFCFAVVFFLATALFLPGVFAGYASTYRLPREDFFRACGRNLWRFIRILIIAGLVMGIVAGLLFAANGAIMNKADDSTNELLPFEVQVIGIAIIFLVMTTLRIWFDLAQADTVLNDQRAVRKSIAAAFRHTFHSLFRLLFSYLVSTLAAALILVVGLWCWLHFAPSDGWVTAAVIAQITLFLLLIPRFWQRGIAVSYWHQHMITMAPVVAPVPVPPVASEPVAPPSTPVLPDPPPAPAV